VAKSKLRLVSPTNENRTVTPRRRPNAELRTREHLTEPDRGGQGQPPRTSRRHDGPAGLASLKKKALFALDLNSLTKNALLALGAACAVMAVLIVVASIFPISGHLRVLVQLIG
jgi:hypothetical protein